MADETLFLHKSVLVQEVLTYLNPQPNKTYLDVTFGSGGHTRALLTQEPKANVIALDWDQVSLDTYAPAFEQEFPGRVHFIWGNFSQLYKILKREKIGPLDGILADFGTSQMQINFREGFSFSKDTPLDMRMSPAYYPYTAAHIINATPEQELARIFWEYGQERHSRAIAHSIVQERGKKNITTTGQLVKAITRVVPFSKAGGIHPATRVFQALRIFVNHELDNIAAFLPAAAAALNKGGRLVCISFHSLEDRMVKEFFHEQQQLTQLQILTKKVVVGSLEEIAQNPSARSAKLRAAERM